MSQSTDITISDQSGADFLTEINAILAAMASGHSGSTAPTYAVAGMEWIDNSGSPWLHKRFDGSDWIITGSYNATTNIFTPYVAGAAIGAAAQYGLGDGVEASGGNIRVKLDGTTLARSSSGMKVAAGGIGTTELDTTGVTAGTYTSADIEVGADGRLISAANGAGGGTVGQSDLDDSVGSVSSTSTAGTRLTLPGGAFGFYPQIKTNSSGGTGFATIGTAGDTTWSSGGQDGLEKLKLISLTTSYASYIVLGSVSGLTVSAQQNYLNASPPFDFGDGNVHGFVYLLIDKTTSDIVATYAANVPPFAYNGKTNIRPRVICGETGTKYRLKRRTRGAGARPMRGRFGAMVAAEVDRRVGQALRKAAEKAKHSRDAGAFLAKKRAEARAAVLEEHYEPITMEMKLRDMADIPHPFGVVPPGHVVVLADPMDPEIAGFMQDLDEGGWDDVQSALHRGLITVDNTPLKRAPIPGVMQCALKFK